MSLRASGSVLRPNRTRKEEHGWAVSYADFLMVLLSFFIMFFSTDPKSTLQQIAVAVDKNNDSGVTSLSGTNNAERPATELLAEIGKKLNGSNLSINSAPKKLTLQLRDNIYPIRGYAPPVTELEHVIQVIKPYQEQLMVTVVGHTDSIKFQKSDQSIINDNFSLSGMRAARAVTYLIERLPNMRIQTQGDSSSSRNTRSLSIILEEK